MLIPTSGRSSVRVHHPPGGSSSGNPFGFGPGAPEPAPQREVPIGKVNR